MTEGKDATNALAMSRRAPVIHDGITVELIVARRRIKAMTRSLSPFRTAKGEARYMAAYEKTMRLWPIPYDPIDVSGTYGLTHLNVSGPPGAPPLLLVHASFCSSAMWAPNIADLSEHHRGYAVDVIDQGGKSVPAQLMKNRRGCAAWMTEVLDALDLPRSRSSPCLTDAGCP